MSSFISDDFLLDTPYARRLYHDHAEGQKIVDYHCHLDPRALSEDTHFENIGQMWLAGDHYKWRAMRAHGLDERLITGSASWHDKFMAWAHTVPYTMRGPLYHWTHLELKRIFGVDECLSPSTAQSIWEQCNQVIANGLTARSIASQSNVHTICTSDDPIDSLAAHRALASEQQRGSTFATRMLPTWRADRAIDLSSIAAYNSYLDLLEQACSRSITTLGDLLLALEERHDYFAAHGCLLSDHSLDTFYSEPYTEHQVSAIFDAARSGRQVSAAQRAVFSSAMLHFLAVMDYNKGWAQQFHIGPRRNVYGSMFESMGCDVGYDSIDDAAISAAGHRFLGRLASEGQLAKTVLYNLNPSHTMVMATMAASFNQGPTPSKVQYGAAWWFLDSFDGITSQIEALSSSGLLAHFVGMLTDSRSILSYPRHEYFRRILCNILGRDLAMGRLPASEFDFIGRMVEDISYNNAINYFGFKK